MTMTSANSVSRAPRPSSLADVLDLILDKGLVIDAYVRVSAVGIEVLTIDARIVIASVDTYLHYAEAVNRLDLTQTETQGITGLFGDEHSSDGRSSNGRSADGRSANGSRSRGDRSQGGRAEGGRSSGRGADRGRSSGRALSRGSREEPESDGDSQDDEEEEAKGRTLARRLSERGRWT